MGCDVDDPAVLLERAELALDRARRFGDVDLEIKALADGGLAHVQAGPGGRGHGHDRRGHGPGLRRRRRPTPSSSAKSVCSFFTACYYAADFERVESWRPMLRQRGLIGAAPGRRPSSAATATACRARCCATSAGGSEAEDVLTRALAELEAGHARRRLAPADRLGRAADPPGPAGRGRGAAARPGRPHPGAAPRPPGCTWPAATSSWPAPPPAGACASWATTGCGPPPCSACWSRPSWQRGDVAGAARGVGRPGGPHRWRGSPGSRRRSGAPAGPGAGRSGDAASAVAALRSGLDGLTGVDLPLLKPRLHLDLARLHEAAGRHGGGRRRGPGRRRRCWPASTSWSRPTTPPCCARLGVGLARRPPAGRVPGGDPDAGRLVVDGRLRRDEGPPARHQGPALPRRAAWPTPASSATPSTSSTWSRASPPPGPASTGAGWATPARCSTAPVPQRLPAPGGRAPRRGGGRARA